MKYATKEEVESGFRPLSADEQEKADAMLDEAGTIIDAYNSDASTDVKKLVSCRMVRRVLNDGSSAGPIGATQGSMGALGYTQSWTMSGGSLGELYISKADKKLLGIANRICTCGPLEAND